MISYDENARVSAALERLLGSPYDVRGEKGFFHCWSFAKYLQKQLWDRDLVEIKLESSHIRDLVKLVRGHPAHYDWKVVERPVHGGLVEMSHSRHPHHIGVWLDLDGGGIAHCEAPAGVSFDPLVALKAAGWRRFTFYEWCG